MQTRIPDKLYFKIGEVAELLALKPHVLRYWESEFDILRPMRSHSKQRRYRRSDIIVLAMIRELLHERQFTLAGAKRYLEARRFADSPNTAPRRERDRIDEVRTLLSSINKDLG
ncbi:MAG: MerR family transcriptional regulator [Candidatus Binatia bacterium]